MTTLIPFVTGTKSAELYEKIYPDSDLVRISLVSSGTAINRVAKLKSSRWVDSAVDGLDHVLSNRVSLSTEQGLGKWKLLIRACGGSDDLVAPHSMKKPPKSKLQAFVYAILDRSHELKPMWLSVPQLPVVNGSERNRFNLALADAAAKWRHSRKFKGSFVLPVIFTHQEQLRRMTDWKKTLRHARKVFVVSDASIIWVVDSSIAGYTASKTIDKRFDSLIEIQRLITEEFPENTVRICGPYWGMNLILWARGLCDYAAIGVGASYQYMIPGFPPFPTSTGKSRVALSPLRRTAVVSTELRAWLKTAISKLGSESQAQSALQYVLTRWSSMNNEDTAREHIAKFYRHWYDQLAKSDKEGRAVTLYQDLSAAYVLGRTLPKLPNTESPSRDAGRIAEQLMLRCL